MITGDGMTVETGQHPPQVQAVNEANRRVRRLRHDLVEGIQGADEDVLSALLVTDDLVRQAEALRRLVLAHTRRRGLSWAAIATATGVPPTTWRTRHQRSTGEE